MVSPPLIIWTTLSPSYTQTTFMPCWNVAVGSLTRTILIPELWGEARESSSISSTVGVSCTTTLTIVQIFYINFINISHWPRLHSQLVLCCDGHMYALSALNASIRYLKYKSTSLKRKVYTLNLMEENLRCCLSFEWTNLLETLILRFIFCFLYSINPLIHILFDFLKNTITCLIWSQAEFLTCSSSECALIGFAFDKSEIDT